MNILIAPDHQNVNTEICIFLAGSIEMGKAEDWQEDATCFIEREVSKNYIEMINNITVLNPRRENWDNSMEQSVENPAFYQQVNWELRGLDKSSHVLFYFAGNTLSPITLMELGKFYKKAFVVVDSNYKRKGNVDVFCDYFDVPQYDTLEQAVEAIFKTLNQD